MLGLRTAQRHQRSKSCSFPDKKMIKEDNLPGSLVAAERVKLDMGRSLDSGKTREIQSSPSSDVQNSLKKEILQLEKKLQDQFEVRRALEKALGYRLSPQDINTNQISMPKPAAELIREIAVLELEVVHLEQYLLSLYRKAFDQPISSMSPKSKNEGTKTSVARPRRLIFSKTDIASDQFGSFQLDNRLRETNFTEGKEDQLDSGVQRCHSELSQRSAFECRTSPEDSWAKAVRACHSQPLSVAEYTNGENLISLAEHLGAHISNLLPEAPNKLSEEMIKCMSTIYCKLADPPSSNNVHSSPYSSLSSSSAISPCDHYDMWSPRHRNNSSFEVRLDNPFHVDGLKEFSGPYSTMVEVPYIYRDERKAADVEDLLQKFKSLISKLEEIDPRKLNHGEKLAFWINVHNALVMHAYLAYGIPQNNIKRVLLLLKAAYNVGGLTVSADTIQSSILGCRMSRPGQWLRFLFASRKFKNGDERQAYAVDRPEPLLHFALCSGSHSDPAVRVYTPKRLSQELETAKEEYIRVTFGVRSKDQKILLPKLVETFSKESGLCPSGIIEMVQKSLPESLRKSFGRCQPGKSRKGIEWLAHDFTFRYLVSKELVR